MLYKTMISAAALAENLHLSSWLILDCRGQFLGGKQSYSSYIDSHIHNAYYCSFSENCLPSLSNKNSITYDSDSSSQVMLDIIAEFGFDPSSQIVIYDNDCNSFTDQFWLQLRSIGCHNVAVLQGGLDSWIEQGYSVTTIETCAN